MNDSCENSFSCNVGFNIQCFTLNNNANKVVVAGRDGKEYSFQIEKYLISYYFSL
jgi:hypothetical protein